MKIRTWIPLFLALLAPGVWAWYGYFRYLEPQPAALSATIPALAASAANGDLAAGCETLERVHPMVGAMASASGPGRDYALLGLDVAKAIALCERSPRPASLREDFDDIAVSLRALEGKPWGRGRDGAARLSLFVAVPAEIFALLVILRYRRRERRLYAVDPSA